MANLMDAWIGAQRKSVSRKLTDHVEVVLNIAGGEWSGDAEVVYSYVPAFNGADDEPPYGEHIEIQSVAINYSVAWGNERKEKRLDVTELVIHCDELYNAVQTQILGD